MSAPPAFQFYAADFIASTTGMTPAQVGAYVRLLCYQWEHGSVPEDRQAIRNITQATPHQSDQIFRSLAAKFQRGPDGRLRNPRLERVRAEQQVFIESRRHGGRARASKSRRLNGQFVPASAGPADQHHDQQKTSPPISDLRSPISVPDPNGTGTSSTTSYIDQRTTGESSNAPVENSPTGLLAGALSAQHITSDEEDPAAAPVVRIPPTLRDRESPPRAAADITHRLGRMEGIDQRPRDGVGVSEADDGGCLQSDGRSRARPSAPVGFALTPVHSAVHRSSVADMASTLRQAKTPEEMGAAIKHFAAGVRRR